MSRHQNPESDHWFSDAPSEVPCGDCGGQVCEFSVPNDVWNAVVRIGRGEGAFGSEYICFGCFHERVTAFVRGVTRGE